MRQTLVAKELYRVLLYLQLSGCRVTTRLSGVVIKQPILYEPFCIISKSSNASRARHHRKKHSSRELHTVPVAMTRSHVLFCNIWCSSVLAAASAQIHVKSSLSYLSHSVVSEPRIPSRHSRSGTSRDLTEVCGLEGMVTSKVTVSPNADVAFSRPLTEVVRE